jgi:hypothetical protein
VKELGVGSRLVVVLLSLTAMLGCSGLNANPPSAHQTSGVVIANETLDFGTVPVGTTAVRTNTIVNNTASAIILSGARINTTDFKITGNKLPVRLAPGEQTFLQIAYSPQNRGQSEGIVVLASNVQKLSPTFTLKGTATTAGQVRLSPVSISFGTVQMGQRKTQSVMLSNSGIIPATVSKVTISGQEFALSGLSLPLILGANQSATFGVNFTPTTSGVHRATISLTSTISFRSLRRGDKRGQIIPDEVASDAVSSIVSLSVSGTGSTASTSTVTPPPGQLAVSPASLTLGSVRMGTIQTRSATLTNSGGSSVTIRQASVTGRGFGMSGLPFPMTLAAGESKTFSVTFAPQTPGAAAGSIAMASDATNSVVSVPVSAVALPPGALASNPSSLSFGSVLVGQGQTLSGTLTNSGGSSLTISQASASGAGFAVSGLNLPATLAPGQSTGFSVTFTPQSGGPVVGNLSFTSDASALTVPLAATGVTAGALAATPSSLSFGRVKAGSSQTLSETLTNSGGTSVTISQASASGAGFAVSGLNLPATLAAGQSTSFSVTFTPPSGGSASGNLSIASNASNPSLTVPLAAAGVTAGVLSSSDPSLSFGNVAVGNSGTQSETLTNSGGSSVTISQANVSVNSFRVTGLSLPMTLSAGQSFTFGVAFAPTTGGGATGTISVVSDASNATLTISLAGTATVTGQLAVSPATLNFGNVIVGQSKSLTGTLTASGSSITVTNAGMTTSEFTVSGLSLPLTLSAGQSASFSVKFTPQASGTAAASAAFTSNASNPSAVESLTGSGTAAPQHSVSLSWNPSSSSVVGYNLYRGTTSGGPFSQINAMNASTSYVDNSVQAGQTYFYVSTAVDAAGRESVYSNQTQAVVPSP